MHVASLEHGTTASVSDHQPARLETRSTVELGNYVGRVTSPPVAQVGVVMSVQEETAQKVRHYSITWHQPATWAVVGGAYLSPGGGYLSAYWVRTSESLWSRLTLSPFVGRAGRQAGRRW